MKADAGGPEAGKTGRGPSGLKGAASAVLAVALLYGIMMLFGITCPIRFVTGISCPGCGMTRAWMHLLAGDIRGAFYYHPLFLIPAVWLLMYLLRKRIPRKVNRVLLYLSAALMIAVYILRMCDHSQDIVVMKIHEGLAARLFALLAGS